MKYLPNLITSLNLISGFISIIFVLNGNLITASWLILAAMVFDFLDGFTARLLKAYSAIGKELDSLADVVSFGVAPAIIIYHLLVNTLQLPETAGFDHNTFLTYSLLCSTAIMPVCAAVRLAIFNTDETQAKSFKGLPTPANAFAVISLVIAAHYSGSGISILITDSPVILVIITIILSFLMISRIPLLSFKTNNLKFRGNEGRYILIFLVCISLIAGGIGSVVLIIPLYLVSSLVALLFK